MLVYGDCADRIDDHYQLSESSADWSLKCFCRLVVENFPYYLNRCPTAQEKERATELMQKRGFPGCFGSWDCKHYFWRNCPTALAGQYKGKNGKTLVMEALVDPELFIWYFNFGAPGSLNDINVLDRSNIVASLIAGTFDNKIPAYKINGTVRDWMYFLADGIYPCWPIFAKSVENPTHADELVYTTAQEHVRKDVERAFGVLVSHFGVLDRKLRHWYLWDLKAMMNCCVIIHNMTVEARRGQFSFSRSMDIPQEEVEEGAPVHSIFMDDDDEVGQAAQAVLAARVAHMSLSIEDAAKHIDLMADLRQHVYDNRHV